MGEFKIKNIELEDVWQALDGYKYALIYGISEVSLVKLRSGEVDGGLLDTQIIPKLKDCMEAYIFDSNKQIHLYRSSDKLVGVLCEDLPNIDSFFDRRYELTNKFVDEEKNIIVREYYEEDDDGQIRISYVRLVDLV